MAKEYSQVRELFLAALDKPAAERERFLASSGAGPAILERVRELLRSSSPHTVLDLRQPSTRTLRSGTLHTAAFGLRRFLRFLRPLASTRAQRWATLLTLLGCLGLGGHLLRGKVRAIATDQAMSAVDALQLSNSSAVLDQLNEWKAAVDAAASPALGLETALAAVREPTAANFASLHRFAGHLLQSGRFSHYALFNTRGSLLAIDGAPVSPSPASAFGRQMFSQAFFTRSTVVSIPGLQRTAPAFAPEGSLIPRVAFYVPLLETGSAEPAGIFFAIRPLSGIAATLGRARTMGTGESFLFDAEGLLLSPSRFESDLIRWGAAARPTVPGALAAVYLRDPGRDLASSPVQPGESPASWERTLLLRTVLAARTNATRLSGRIERPYRDYRGELVVASWRWMPELGLGMATEMDAREVLETATLVDRALLTLLGLLALGCVWLVVSSGWLVRLRREANRRDMLGPYSLLEKLGEGGMGEVFLARHALLKRNAALKLLRRDRDNDGGLRHFEREAQLVSQLRHPNTVSLYDFGLAKDGSPYFAMEYLPGLNLAEWVKRTGPMPAARAIHVVRQIAGALSEAHRQGLLHCDVKPTNVMLCTMGGVRDYVKLLDFGLAYSMRAASGAAGSEHGGTPYYTAPERLEGAAELDARYDIYSVGVLWFHILTGALPFPAEVPWVEASLKPDRPLVRAYSAAVDPVVERLIHACMARHPQDRPASVDALLEELNAMAQRFPWTAAQAESCWAPFERSP